MTKIMTKPVMTGKYMKHLLLRKTLLLLAAMIIGLGASAQEITRITGNVVDKKTGHPVFGVNIQDARTKKLIATTDENGHFAVDYRTNATLVFTMVSADPVTVHLRGKDKVEVQLEIHDQILSEATVSVKRKVDEIMPEDTELIIEGNWAKFNQIVRFPNELLRTNTRAVVQPFLYNASKDQVMVGEHHVLDSKEYHKTQTRMYDFDFSQDPLSKNVTVRNDSTKDKKNKNANVIAFRDSFFLDDPRDDVRLDVYSSLENYTHLLYKGQKTTAKGTKNPLRFFDYGFAAVELTDTTYFPKQETQLRDSKGEINIQFAVGKSNVDEDDPHNKAELEKLERELNAIASSRGATIDNFNIEGTSSPEGTYVGNIRLAELRMKNVQDLILSRLSSEIRQGMQVKHSAKVAPWEEVAALLRKDSLFAEAEQVENIIMSVRSIDVQGRRMRNLPFYNLLNTKYLPMLRKAQYEMKYSVYRVLTIDEIRALYNKDYTKLTRYEFFRLYRGEPDEAQREKYLQQALEVYPQGFVVAANDYAAMRIRQGRSDERILADYAGKKAPVQVNMNQIVAMLDSRHYSDADTLVKYVPETDDSRLLLAVTGVLNGRIEENFATVAETSPLNEVLLLLKLERNEEALQKVELLPKDNAVNQYVRAICLNRTDNVNPLNPILAQQALKEAFRLDPKLEKIAPLDADVNSLLEDGDEETMN